MDEIGDTLAGLQALLLRVLAEGEFYRAGCYNPDIGSIYIAITATHQNLEQRIRDELFRDDLCRRLNVIRIQLPLLGRWREDIPLLTLRLGQVTRELGG